MVPRWPRKLVPTVFSLLIDRRRAIAAVGTRVRGHRGTTVQFPQVPLYFLKFHTRVVLLFYKLSTLNICYKL